MTIWTIVDILFRWIIQISKTLRSEISKQKESVQLSRGVLLVYAISLWISIKLVI